ncbi:hypothetical protein Tco_0690271 [Tanacetum coccineum]
MVISLPCLTDIKNWQVQKQTTFGKDFLNPFIADSLLKTMLYSKELASPKQTSIGKDISNPLIVGSLLKTIWLSVPATSKEISNPFMAGEDYWVLEDFTTYCYWFNIGAVSEDLVLLRKIEENRLSL